MTGTVTEECKDGEVPAQVISQPTGAMIQDPNCAKPLGDPIPGYSGISRRVQADNIFGMTFSEARRMAVESQNRILSEKEETLAQTSQYIPEDQRIKKTPFFQ